MTEKHSYLDRVSTAKVLQEQFIREAGVDVLARVSKVLTEVTGLPVRVAMEGGRDYFAGMLRAMDHGVQIHADYGPYVSSLSIKLRHILTWIDFA